MVDVTLLSREYGLDQKFFRATLGRGLKRKTPPQTSNEPQTPDDNEEKRLALHNRIKNRIDEGMKRNFENYRTNYALDLAWDIPFKQITPTLLQTLIDKDPNSEFVQETIKGWGLDNLLVDETDAKSGQPTGKKALNIPLFYNVYVPLVRAYVTIRWAKIVNDRRLKPFFKYEPAKLTMKHKVKCEVITDRIEVMNTQFNYFETMKQGVLKMLHYGKCLQFIREEWYCEYQDNYVPKMVEKAVEVQTEAGVQRVGAMVQETDAAGKPVFTIEKVIVKEGLRYEHPHPSRTYRDLSHPAYTLNTDTGCEFAGYWKIIRFREIYNNPAYYGSEEIPLNDTDIRKQHSLFFQTVYSACTLSCPVMTSGTEGGVGEQDAQKKVASIWYGSEYLDQGIVVTQHFEKINPKRDGLVNPAATIKGGYEGDVWFRFLIAGTSGNIIYAAPLPDTPATYAGYDADESRDQNPSMSLEILPFQDQFGNVLSQMLLDMKQNAANLVLIDEDQIKEATIDKIKGMGERFFRRLNIQGFSSTKAKKAQHQVPNAIQSFKFPQTNTTEKLSALKVILDTLERILVMSSQEVGQAASHEQTREEIKNLATTSSSRLVFTTTPVDQQRDAWKRQLYAYDMAYGSAEFTAQVPCDREITMEDLTQMGFTYDPEEHHGNDKYLTVKANRQATAIPLHQFSSTRDGEDRSNDAQQAQVLSQLVQVLLGNPMTAQAVGPEQAIAFANAIAQFAGLPRDFKIRSLIKDGDMKAGEEAAMEQQQEAQAMLQQVAKEVIEKAQENTEAAMKPLEKQIAQVIAESETTGIKIKGILKLLKENPPTPST